MRLSCNGCRVLRKGCTDDCSIRPCLQWIRNPESQANATFFLAKFYGRAGLLNLINAGPEHLRPGIFRSLLYEACGRIVNPIDGSVGLLRSGSWQLCEAAVEAVLKGAPITPIATEDAADGRGPPLKAFDIRHISKAENSDDVDRVKNRCRVKRTVKWKGKNNKKAVEGKSRNAEAKTEPRYCSNGGNRSTSHESSLSHQSELAVVDGESKETDSMITEETTPASPLFPEEPEFGVEVGLELTLGVRSAIPRGCHSVVPVKKRKMEARDTSEKDRTCIVELGLAYPA